MDWTIRKRNRLFKIGKLFTDRVIAFEKQDELYAWLVAHLSVPTVEVVAVAWKTINQKVLLPARFHRLEMRRKTVRPNLNKTLSLWLHFPVASMLFQPARSSHFLYGFRLIDQTPNSAVGVLRAVNHQPTNEHSHISISNKKLLLFEIKTQIEPIPRQCGCIECLYRHLVHLIQTQHLASMTTTCLWPCVCKCSSNSY